MPRWPAGAKQRLVLAAVDLFAEHGYDATTVAQICERAEVGKSTFFRYFADKREILVAGQETLAALLSEGAAAAPLQTPPVGVVESALRGAASIMDATHQQLGNRLQSVIAGNAELRARESLKQIGLAETLAAALRRRGMPDHQAAAAAELGILAFRQACEQWFKLEKNASTTLDILVVRELRDIIYATRLILNSPPPPTRQSP